MFCNGLIRPLHVQLKKYLELDRLVHFNDVAEKFADGMSASDPHKMFSLLRDVLKKGASAPTYFHGRVCGGDGTPWSTYADGAINISGACQSSDHAS
eukprot:1076021-Karenia_brevis.AAC.1